MIYGESGESDEYNLGNSSNSKFEYTYSVKFIIVGDSSVGKSNILLRFSRNVFDPGHQATLGIEFANKHLQYNNTDYLVQVWDTAGQENFRSVTRAYYKASAVAMVVYDISSEESFQHIQTWIKDCQDLAPKTVQLVLVGNKSDLEEQRAIQTERGEELAKRYNMLFFETSALNGNGVEEAFQKSIEAVDQKIRSGFYDLNNSSNQGIKKIYNGSDGNERERVIDKKSLSIGKKQKNNNECCNL
jgi:small GTP-binding protein